jgi:DNA-binding response OmpR family regulator
LAEFRRIAAWMRRRILVVDDDPGVVELICYNLEKAGFMVETAADGVMALKKARAVSPDAILLDLMMPELDGFSVCESLRRDPATSTIPIMVVSAARSEFARLNGMNSGANEFVSKPFSPKRLIERLQALFGDGGAATKPQIAD